MKILIFSWRDIRHPGWGGAEVLTMELAKRWISKGCQVSIVSSKFPGCLNFETLNRVKIFRPATLPSFSPPKYIRYLLETYKFYRHHLAGKYDLVLDQVHGLPFFTPLFVREKTILFPLEVAQKIWFYEMPFPFSLAGYLAELFYITLFRNVPFLTISPSTEKDLKKLGAKKIMTIIPGINFSPLPHFPHKSKTPLFVSLGRITEMKRITDTLQAFRLLHKEIPLIKLIIIGQGKDPYLQRLKNLCCQMAIEDRVNFTGYVSEKEKKRLLSQAWFMVSTSLKEGWGLVVIEAAACGTPTVAYRVAGLVDSIKDGKTGLLCRKNTPEELARNIKILLKNPSLRKEISRNALSYSRSFSWDKAANEAFAIFGQIIRSSPRDKH